MRYFESEEITETKLDRIERERREKHCQCTNGIDIVLAENKMEYRCSSCKGLIALNY